MCSSRWATSPRPRCGAWPRHAGCPSPQTRFHGPVLSSTTTIRRFLHLGGGGHASRPIVDRSGRVYGEHSGLPGYTIGQRKGLGISGAAEPLFVLELDYRHNTLVVGSGGNGARQPDGRTGHLDAR